MFSSVPYPTAPQSLGSYEKQTYSGIHSKSPIQCIYRCTNWSITNDCRSENGIFINVNDECVRKRSILCILIKFAVSSISCIRIIAFKVKFSVMSCDNIIKSISKISTIASITAVNTIDKILYRVGE